MAEMDVNLELEILVEMKKNNCYVRCWMGENYMLAVIMVSEGVGSARGKDGVG